MDQEYSEKSSINSRPRRRWVRAVMIALLLLFTAAIVALAVMYFRWEPPVTYEVVIEAGEPMVGVERFLGEYAPDGGFAAGVESIDTSVPGRYPVGVEYSGMLNSLSYECWLVVRDTTPPTGKALTATVKKGTIPEVESLVTDISDVTAVTVEYKEPPDVSAAGEVPAVIVLTDTSGNILEIETTVTVIADTVPPEIVGAHDMEAFIGDAISYRTDVSVTDNEDPSPTLEIDTSGVDMTAEGVYDVVYRAFDADGNMAEVTVKLTLTEKPANYVDPEIVLAEAGAVLDRIVTEDMDSMDVAYAIYRWAKYNIGYVNTSDKSSWTGAAHQAFTVGQGDCYVYFAACKALLTAAGIDNMDVIKSDTSHSQHFWNLVNVGSGWYHLDTTPRVGPGDNFFMVTDAELEAYSSVHRNSHVFDPTLYPERATESVQDAVDYGSARLKR